MSPTAGGTDHSAAEDGTGRDPDAAPSPGPSKSLRPSTGSIVKGDMQLACERNSVSIFRAHSTKARADSDLDASSCCTGKVGYVIAAGVRDANNSKTYDNVDVKLRV